MLLRTVRSKIQTQSLSVTCCFCKTINFRIPPLKNSDTVLHWCSGIYILNRHPSDSNYQTNLENTAMDKSGTSQKASAVTTPHLEP